MGILRSERRQNEEAESLLLQALKIRQALSQVDPNTYLAALATSQSNLGTWYRKQAKLTKAEALYLECLSTRQKLSKDNPSVYEGDLAAIEHNLGTLSIALQKFPEAQDYLSTALDRRRRLAEGAPAVYSPLLASTQHSLGYLFVQLGKFKQAEQAYQEALTLREQLSLENPVIYQVELGTILISQGYLFYQTEQWDEAASAYLRALQVWEKLAAEEPGLYSVEVARAANALGSIYDHGLGDKVKTEAWYRKALAISRLSAREGVDQYVLEVAQSAVVLASFLLEKRDAEAAKPLFLEAMQISDRYAAQASSRRIADLVIKSIGIEQADPDFADWERKAKSLVRAVQNEKDERDKMRPQQAVLMHWQTAHQEHPGNPRVAEKLAAAYGNWARLQLFAEDFQSAEKYARRGLALAPELGDAQAPLAVALLFQNRYQEALPLFRLCRNKRKSKFLSWGASLQFDLKKLEAKGFTHPKLDEVKAILDGE
ncbi:MAG: tetratricopeptide repeat protein [Saprospiraceae bacterium]|nr:tetratricopeptide repeat protein [Saprospiraceae bacterium]